MKKFICVLLAVFLMVSFSGCLKDDYEALELDINDLEDSISEIDGEVTDLEDEKATLESDISSVISEKEDLDNQLANLVKEKEMLEEKIELTSDHGLGFTKFEFELAFSNLIEMPKFAHLNMSSLPIQTRENGIRKLRYYLYIGEDLSEDLFYELELSGDGENIEKIIFAGGKKTSEGNEELFGHYLGNLSFVTIMCIEESYDSFNFDTNLVTMLFAGEPLYNNSVILETDESGNFYTATIIDTTE